MNGIICRASAAADANQFTSASHRDALQSINTALLVIWRAFALLFFSLCALVHNAITIPFVRPDRRLHARAAWLRSWCRFACLVLGIRVTTHGSVPSSGLLVSNHLSYLDIIVLSSIRPCVFVAKRDVARWLLFGWLARAASTIFVDRERRFSSGRVVNRIRDAIAGGSVVVLFPEGTSSDGSTVLPFKSALLESAVQLRCQIAAASIDYAHPAETITRDESPKPDARDIQEAVAARLGITVEVILSPRRTVDRRGADRHRANADAGIMTALGHDVGIGAAAIHGAPRGEDRRRWLHGKPRHHRLTG